MPRGGMTINELHMRQWVERNEKRAAKGLEPLPEPIPVFYANKDILSGRMPADARTIEAVKKEMQRRGALPPDDSDFVKNCHTYRNFMLQTSPSDWNVDFKHLKYLRNALNRVTSGECKRLMVFMPPRHGKSESITIRYPLFRLEKKRDLRIVIASYNHDLAEQFTRKARRIAEGRIPLDTSKTAADDWQTVEGGGFRAVGVGGGITGRGGDLIFIDDPIKSREESLSELYRDKLWDWYRDDLYTRLEPGGAIVLVITRWHADDLAGRILTSEQAPDWTVISIPAIAEENDPLGREVGMALCPERYDLTALEDIRSTLGDWSFESLYQQHPTAKEGALFKVSNLKIVSEGPGYSMPTCRAWDFAGTHGGGDYTVGLKLSGPDLDGLWYVTDMVRGQWGPDERNRRVLMTAQCDGVSVKIRGAQDPGSAGKDTARALIRMLEGYSVKTERVSGNKEIRADPVISAVNNGNMRLVRGAWINDFVAELRTFPLGKHDDCVDAFADAYTELSSGKRRGRAY